MKLLTASPVNVHPEVWEASRRELTHRCPEFEEVLVSVKKKLCDIAGKKFCSILNGNGSLAVEAALQTFTTQTRVYTKGVYSERLKKKGDSYYTWDGFVHCETDTGRMNELKNSGHPVLLDAVSSFGAVNADWKSAEVICTCGNKALESLCGCAIVLYDDFLITQSVRHPFDVLSYKNNVPCTLNVPAILALDKALDLLKKEDRVLKYKTRADGFVRAIGKYFPLLLPRKEMSNNILTFRASSGEYKRFHDLMKENGYQIYKYIYNYFLLCTMGWWPDEPDYELVESLARKACDKSVC